MEVGFDIRSTVLQKNALGKISETLPKMITDSTQPFPGIKIYDSNPENLVFEITEVTQVIFKVGSTNPYQMEKRYNNILAGKTICREEHLSQLKIPDAELFDVKIGHTTYRVLAEEKMEITHDISLQEQIYEQKAPHLDKAISQLAVLIIRLQWADVEWRNASVLNGVADAEGNLFLVLNDLEDVGDIQLGLFGGVFQRTGLVGLVNEDQAKQVIEIAKRSLPWDQEWEDASQSALKSRIETLGENNRLRQFYGKKGVVTGQEPVVVELSQLGLSPDLHQAAVDILDLINEGIPKQTGRSVKWQRKVVLQSLMLPDFIENPNDHLKRLARMHFYKSAYPGDTQTRVFMTSSDDSILAVVLDKLIQHEVIFKRGRNQEGWYAQV